MNEMANGFVAAFFFFMAFVLVAMTIGITVKHVESRPPPEPAFGCYCAKKAALGYAPKLCMQRHPELYE